MTFLEDFQDVECFSWSFGVYSSDVWNIGFISVVFALVSLYRPPQALGFLFLGQGLGVVLLTLQNLAGAVGPTECCMVGFSSEAELSETCIQLLPLH